MCIYVSSDSGGRMDPQSEGGGRRFYKEHTAQTKKHGGRSTRRGAAQTGNRPPANPNAFNRPQDRRDKSGRFFTLKILQSHCK